MEVPTVKTMRWFSNTCLVEKKVSQTAAQELDARLRILGSVSSARPAPPSRRTTIGPRPRALHAFSGVLLGWGFE